MYARSLNGVDHTFIVSGMLWRNSLVMLDLETDTAWSHITGHALWGELDGTTLPTIPSVQTTWSEWVEAHPKTKLLVKDEDVRSSHYASYFADPERNGLFRTEWLQDRLPGKTKVHGVTIGPFAVAVTDLRMDGAEPVEAELGEHRVRFERLADGGVAASRLDADGEVAEALTSGVYFWFAWSTFYPNTAVID